MARTPTRFSYVNCHGDRFFLHVKSASGKSRAFFMAKYSGRALTKVPSGYEVRENANGHVSVRRCRGPVIFPAETNLVRTAVARMRPHGYKVHSDDRSITILASAQDQKTFSGSVDAEFAEGFASALEETLSRRYGRELADLFRAKRQQSTGKPARPRFYPLLRFQLADLARRRFSVRRIYFTGDQDWLPLEELSLPAAVMKYVPHLGRETFFDLL